MPKQELDLIQLAAGQVAQPRASAPKIEPRVRKHAQAPGVTEGLLLHKDGHRIPIEITPSYVTTPDGRHALIGVLRDLRERDQACEELRRSEGRARAGDGTSCHHGCVPAAIFVAHDPKGRHITGNRAAYAVLRQEPGSNLSMSSGG